jgi:cellulose synthase/poly-beta-1,6-N-acetylglucosamine synthase-like glycosyltransferase
MASLGEIIFYILMFLAAYAQIFFFVTFIENRKKIITRSGSINLQNYPGVTIIVPSYNEEKTVANTVKSLLDLNYPKDKLKIILIDDGSTDKTLEEINKFASNSSISIYTQKNGGKYQALNLGLTHTTTEFVGCLDADSFADRESVIRIMSYFEADPETMAVVPSVTVSSDKHILQKAQKAEYQMGVYFKKMLGFMGAINVTPGPLTIFRKKVFDDLGPYRHAHNTEDMEIAYRMQKNYYKITHCHDAYVYTNTPSSLYKLYRQRLRWIYGFINNSIDYRDILFRKRYGNFSLFAIPTGLISTLAVLYLFYKLTFSLFEVIYSNFVKAQVVGFNFSSLKHTDPFFINANAILFLGILIYALVLFAMILGRKITEGKTGISFNMILFLIIFRVIAPFWVLKAIYNTVISKAPSWR